MVAKLSTPITVNGRVPLGEDGAALYSQRNPYVSVKRVSERTRIARDFHDTLLQSFQGVLLKLQAVTYLFAERPAEARKTLETSIEEDCRGPRCHRRFALFGDDR